MFGTLKTALQAAVLVAGTGTAVTMAPDSWKFWEDSDLERLQNKIEEVQAEVQVLELQKQLRSATAEREVLFATATEIVEAARAKYPDIVAVLEAQTSSVLETAELVKALD